MEELEAMEHVTDFSVQLVKQGTPTGEANEVDFSDPVIHYTWTAVVNRRKVRGGEFDSAEDAIAAAVTHLGDMA